MPRKTKKQKLLAQLHQRQLPKKETPVIIHQTENVVLIEKAPETKVQLPLLQQTKPRHVEATDLDAATYFRYDIRKTALLTGIIIAIEIVLYKLMATGLLKI